MTQLDLIPQEPRLTSKQRLALDYITAEPGGVTDQRLGFFLHFLRVHRCLQWDCEERGYHTRDGRAMGQALRAKGLVVKRGRTHWQAVTGQTMPAPQGLGDLPEGF